MGRHTVQATCYDRRGRKISVAINSYSVTHPMQAHFARLAGIPEKEFLHAEIRALLRAKDRKVHSIHIERYHKDGSTALAQPCPACALAISAFGVQYVTYTEEEPAP